MTITRRTAFVFVRATGAPIPASETQQAVSGQPTAPASWKWSRVGDTGWLRARTPDGALLHAKRINTSQIDPNDGVWIVVEREPGGTVKLEELAAHASNTFAASMLDLWLLARSGDATARMVLRHWSDWKVSGFKNGESGLEAFTGQRRILADGNRFPADVLTGGGPWHFDRDGSEVPHLDPTEIVHVTTFHRPALTQTFAGYADHVPEDGTPED